MSQTMPHRWAGRLVIRLFCCEMTFPWQPKRMTFVQSFSLTFWSRLSTVFREKTREGTHTHTHTHTHFPESYMFLCIFWVSLRRWMIFANGNVSCWLVIQVTCVTWPYDKLLIKCMRVTFQCKTNLQVLMSGNKFELWSIYSTKHINFEWLIPWFSWTHSQEVNP